MCFMSVSVLSDPEVQSLIRDLDLVPSSSPVAQNAYAWRIAVVHRYYQLRSYYRNLLPFDFDFRIPLDIMYHRFNSKGKKRSFGSALVYQLELFRDVY